MVQPCSEEDLPIAQDMKKHNVKGVLFEVLFPSTFPFSPPFFRVISPRFLPFAQGVSLPFLTVKAELS